MGPLTRSAREGAVEGFDLMSLLKSAAPAQTTPLFGAPVA
jgi:hypothetical protein